MVKRSSYLHNEIYNTGKMAPYTEPASWVSCLPSKEYQCWSFTELWCTKFQNLNVSHIILLCPILSVGTVPTTSQWSTISLLTKVQLILEVWQYIQWKMTKCWNLIIIIIINVDWTMPCNAMYIWTWVYYSHVNRKISQLWNKLIGSIYKESDLNFFDRKHMPIR